MESPPDSDTREDQAQHVSLKGKLKLLMDQKGELLKMQKEKSLNCFEVYALEKTEDEIEQVERQIKEESESGNIDMNCPLRDTRDSEYDPKENNELEDHNRRRRRRRRRRPNAKDARTAHTRKNEKYERKVAFPWMESYQQGQKRLLNSTQLTRRKRRAGQKDAGIGKLDYVDAIQAQNAQSNDQDMLEIEGTTKKAIRDHILATAGSRDIHQTKAGWSELDEASRLMGYKNCTPENNKWRLKNLRCSLYPHQLLAANFMLMRECSIYGPNGGINADAMGLGKTVEALATIVSNPPQADDIEEDRKATLIVSYENLMADFGNAKLAKEARDNGWSIEGLHNQKDINLGPLFQVKFYRIILDEGHRAKNDKTLTCTACRYLDSKYRWLLTGTPIHNSVGELYAYCKFLEAPWTKNMTYKEFNSKFVDEEEKISKERLNMILSVIMIRRTHQDTILGKPLFSLPLAHRELLRVPLSTDLEPIYKQYRMTFNTPTGQVVNKNNNDGKKDKVTRFLTKILWLRGLADSPMLAKYLMAHDDDMEDVRAVLSKLARLRGKNTLYDILHKWCYGLNGLRAANEAAEICLMCNAGADAPFTVKKAFARQQKNMNERIKDTRKRKRGPRREKGHNDNPRESSPGEDFYYRKPNHQHKVDERIEFDMMAYGKTDAILGEKMCAVRAVISKWQSEAPDDKIIVFTHFNGSGEIVGHLLQAMSIQFAYFFGNLSQPQRDQIVMDFNKKPELKVLIISIKCGGEALQLTSANRVIILEPWWNLCVEEQAFGRVFRLGQEKETYLLRILTRNTIEPKVYKLQKKKARSIANTLQDSTSKETDISLKEVATLLGRVTHDADGNIRIESDSEDDEEDEDGENENEDKGKNETSSMKTVQDHPMS
ncbi:P-loop containing nucleoside triphosphate hydrolase protein [Camillea tinctor]|nr:P-loop containing nucleoside triphosphate hydrolase protein [Camillea tinctor]